MSKVYVGLSGGVDSSLVASLLLEAGHQVTGVYMKNWSQDLPGMNCPWAEDLADAKRVAVQLGIDFKVFDFEKDYKQKVVNHMIEQYKLGLTPNPDVMCNQEIKFKLFLEAALSDGADNIATGHYAQSEGEKLLRAVDDNKDQTYFLYRVSGWAIGKTIFPIGHLAKPQVRQMAKARGLKTASKKDSQGICFIGQVGIKDFLSLYVKTEVGDLVDKKTNKKIGSHQGAIFYTLGQRHGLDIGGGLPYYVVGKDIAKNEVYVTTDLNDDSLWKKTIKLSSLHWINERPPEGIYQVRVRHRAPLAIASLKFIGDEVEINLDSPERSIAPGQSVVVYDGQICLGGGIINSK